MILSQEILLKYITNYINIKIRGCINKYQNERNVYGTISSFNIYEWGINISILNSKYCKREFMNSFFETPCCKHMPVRMYRVAKLGKYFNINFS